MSFSFFEGIRKITKIFFRKTKRVEKEEKKIILDEKIIEKQQNPLIEDLTEKIKGILEKYNDIESLEVKNYEGNGYILKTNIFKRDSIRLIYSVDKEYVEINFKSECGEDLKRFIELKTYKEENFIKIKKCENNGKDIIIEKDIKNYMMEITKKYLWENNREFLDILFFIDYDNKMVTSDIFLKLPNFFDEEKYIKYIVDNFKILNIEIEKIYKDEKNYLFIMVEGNKKGSEVYRYSGVYEEWIECKLKETDNLEQIIDGGAMISIILDENYMRVKKGYDIFNYKKIIIKKEDIR